eukprot:1156313-Pelagomonas_calceolata.AAC.5
MVLNKWFLQQTAITLPKDHRQEAGDDESSRVMQNNAEAFFHTARKQSWHWRKAVCPPRAFSEI